MNPSCSTKLSRGSLGIALIAMLFLTLDYASAKPTYRDAFLTEYPGAVGSRLDSVPSHATHCGVCHFDFGGGGARNPYGIRLGQVLPNYSNNLAGRRLAMQFIQNEDNDGDGKSTLVEITDTVNYSNTPTFPGLTAGNVGSVSNVTVSEIQGYLTPLAAPDTTPPSVALISPNGGQTLFGNSAATIQWSASDPSGIASIDFYLSDDNGASYRPLMLNVGNSGNEIVYLPNRPTTQARFRVRAIDGAGNSATDDSNAVFAISAFPLGVAPTTLRDFDLPGSQPFDVAPITDPNFCAACHGGYDAAVEPHTNWQGSMMAHASLDPLFEACMAIANQDAPDSGDLCLRCHLPTGWLAGRSIPTSGVQMSSSDKFGVSCDACHRLVDPIYQAGNPPVDQGILSSLATAPTTFGNGMYVIDPTGERRGPFADATSGHSILVSPFHREAALCGTCHDVSNPAFQKDGNGHFPPNAFNTPPSTALATELMPIERTYSEWLNSEYNSPSGVYAPQFGGNLQYVASCQDCHMRDVTGKGCAFPAAPIRNDLPLHDMTGGSTWLAGLMPILFPNEVPVDPIQAGVQRARYMLQNAASLSASQQGNEIKVRVTNETGHKLPTGYPEGRRMWINVRVFDAQSNLLAESAAYDASTGVLTQDPQSVIYEAKPGLDTDTASLVGVSPGPSFHFVLNNKIYKDNRIPPRGFQNSNFAAFGGAPVGHAYSDGQYWDDSNYPVPPLAATVEIRLYYQSTSKEYVEFLRDANTTNSAGQFMYDAWNLNGKCPPELMASMTLPVEYQPSPGDLDADGDIDAFDTGIFVDVLLGTNGNPTATQRSDINQDSHANGDDVQGFVAAFIG